MAFGRRRVVVTGVGLVTPLGTSVPVVWDNILAGKSGIRPLVGENTEFLRSRICGNVPDFDVTPYLSHKDARKTDRFVHYGVAAAAQAIADAQLEVHPEQAGRMGVAVGSGIGGIETIARNCASLEQSGPRSISPFFIPSSIINMVAGYISILNGLQGPNISIVTACTTGAHNIGYAARTVAYGDADVMVAGGAEYASTLLGIGGFAAARALSTRNDAPEQASRPWDKDRDGFVLSDGAGIVVLEAYEHAKARGATVYGELLGFGMSADAHHITLPSGAGAVHAMHNALSDAHITPDQVDYINAHGTSTPAGDKVEAQAIQQVFGAHAAALAVSSTKSMTGHMLGATGAVEVIFSLLAMRDQVVPPTINLDHPDEGLNLNFVPHTAQERKVTVSLSNSFGFGGTNATLLLRSV